MNHIRVLIADDHEVAIEGLRSMISDSGDIEILQEITELDTLPDVIAETNPDAVILDIAWDDDKVAGIKMIRQLRQLYPSLPVIAITAYPELVELARQAGAQTLDKGFNRKKLWRVVRWAARQESYPPDAPGDEDSKPVGVLTLQENKVLNLLIEGLSNAQIALKLHTSIGTVKKQVSSVLKKTGAASRTEAAYKAKIYNLPHKLPSNRSDS